MNREREQFEQDVVELVRRVLHDFAGRLHDHGLTVDVDGPLVFQPDLARYGCEMEIQLKRGGNIVDVLEFPLFRDGRQIASLREVEQWLVENLNGAIESSSAKRS